MDEEHRARLRAFMDELGALTLKHGVAVTGCGCCGSPSMRDVGAGFTHYRSDMNGDDLRAVDDRLRERERQIREDMANRRLSYRKEYL